MTDYDGLVKALRDEAEYADVVAYMHGIKSISHRDATAEIAGSWAQLFHKAADAIEELSKLADAIPHVCECCVGWELEKKNGGCDHAFLLSPKRAMQYLIKPRWIPVTERLPEDDQVVYVCGILNAVVWTDLASFYADTWHLYVVPEQGKVKVTHWMPLPAPPKEET